jgi:fructose-specific phosphotransferase system IIC component
MQLAVGFLITRGTIPIAAAPLIGSIPKFIVGGLVAASSSQQILAGVRALLGKS